jgi:hypothetical protein
MCPTGIWMRVDLFPSLLIAAESHGVSFYSERIKIRINGLYVQ